MGLYTPGCPYHCLSGSAILVLGGNLLQEDDSFPRSQNVKRVPWAPVLQPQEGCGDMGTCFPLGIPYQTYSFLLASNIIHAQGMSFPLSAIAHISLKNFYLFKYFPAHFYLLPVFLGGFHTSEQKCAL